MQADRTTELSALLQQRLLVLDGAMGTMIQQRKLQEADYRGERFADHPRDLKAWIKLFKTRFRFVGGEIVNEFLMSIGYLEGAHRPDCPVFARIAAENPAWMQKKRQGA